MLERLSRGWAMARSCFVIVRRYPKLAVLPAISGAAFLIVLGLAVASLLPQLTSLHAITEPLWAKVGPDTNGYPLFLAACFVVYYLLVALAVFCNVALIGCALRCHAGQEPSLRDGVAAAMGRLPQILGWALVAATVGIILNAIEGFLEDKLGFLGSLIGGLFEFGWSVVTYFVLPVLAAEGIGPIAAVRRSSAILRSKWGESLAGETRFGLVGLLFYLQAALLFFAGLALHLSYGPAAVAPLAPILIALGIVYAVVITVVLQTLSTVFLTGVYLYATTDRVPPTLDPDLVVGAFRSKR